MTRPVTGQPGNHSRMIRPVTGQPGSHSEMTRPGTGLHEATGHSVSQFSMTNPYTGNEDMGHSFHDEWENQQGSHSYMTRPATGQPGTGQPGTRQPGSVRLDRIDTRYHSFAAQPDYLDIQNTGLPGFNNQPADIDYGEYISRKSFRSPRGTVYYSRDITPPRYQPSLRRSDRFYDRQVSDAYRDRQIPDYRNLRLPEGHLSKRQSFERQSPDRNIACSVKGKSKRSHTVSSAPMIDSVQHFSAADRRLSSHDRHQLMDLSENESISGSEIGQPVGSPVKHNTSRRRPRQSSTSSSDEETESLLPIEDEPAADRWSLQQAIEEVFRVVPSTLCPKIDAPPRRKNLSSLEEHNAEIGGSTTPLQLLPQANNLGRLLDQLQSTRSLDTVESAWSVPLAISKEWVSPKAYVASKEFFPVKVPALDGDASTLGLTAPTSITVSAKLVERWEARARLGVMVASHDDHFAIALALLLKEENVSSRGASRILEAFDTGNRHLMALNLQNATEMLSARRDATLVKSSSLLQNSKDSLRAAPLSSNLLFGGRVAAVTVTDSSEQSRRLSASAVNALSQSRKYSAPAAKWTNTRKPPAKKQKQEVKAVPPKQPPSTGRNYAKPKPRFTGAKPKHTSRYGTAPRPQP